MSDYQEYTSKMEKTVSVLEKQYATVRAGRANPAVLDQIRVEYYGTPTPIQQIAAVSSPDSRTLVIQPWDPSALKLIEKAIQASDLGINPQNDGRIIRLTFPQPGQGTLAARMPKADPALKKRVYMKSGSMNGVRCFCGYVTPADGQTENTIVFSLMINNATATSATLNPLIDQLLTAIASQ